MTLEQEELTETHSMTAQAIPAGKFKTLSHENLPKGASMSHNVIGAWRGKR